MTIGFYHVDDHSEAGERGYVWARQLVKSARKVMPWVRIVHFTDLTSPPVKGVHTVRRKPSEPMALLRMRHHAGVSGDWLFVDTDVVFQRDVTHIFEQDFDIAITTRTWPHLRAAVGFTERMPFNTGVVFSRCPRFWQEAYTRLRGLPLAEQMWMGDQSVICEMVEDHEGRYAIAQVNGAKYNYPPPIPPKQTVKEATQAASIVHYKGEARKAMLLQRVATCA